MYRGKLAWVLKNKEAKKVLVKKDLYITPTHLSISPSPYPSPFYSLLLFFPSSFFFTLQNGTSIFKLKKRGGGEWWAKEEANILLKKHISYMKGGGE